MKTSFILSLLLFITIATCPKAVTAVVDPLAVPNNRFGIHITDEGDLEDAARLVNSNGGDWGYVTIVIQEWDRDPVKWQATFDKMSKLHLIPLVRIAANSSKSIWELLKKEEAKDWTAFLNSLSWPTINKYIIIGNEPNHAKEWGGALNPEEYVTTLKEYSIALKEANPNFFILPAGMDASAPNSRSTLDEVQYLKRMVQQEPSIFDYIDGWTSHSYPNPAFSGSETASGRGTIQTYKWELGLLNELGIKKQLPVFITETGWVHSLNGRYPILTPTQEIGLKLSHAFDNVWSDPQIVAVTPFILNYQQSPFDEFSWKDHQGQFFSFYFEIQQIEKLAGKPKLPIKTRPPKFRELPSYNPSLALLNVKGFKQMHNLAIFGRI